MKTEQTYMKDCYLRELDAKVLDGDASEKWIVLDRTIFYPEAGGQPADSGTISWQGGECRVVNVKKTGEVILHFCEGALPEKGTSVKLKVDWEKRYAHMRYHSAQHLLAGILLNDYGCAVHGNQLYANRARIDFEIPEGKEIRWESEVKKFNDAVDAQIPVEKKFITREEVSDYVGGQRLNLFSRLPEFVKEIRIVKIAEHDVCPCGGTHVDNTKELGHIKIDKLDNKGKGIKRVEFSFE